MKEFKIPYFFHAKQKKKMFGVIELEKVVQNEFLKTILSSIVCSFHGNLIRKTYIHLCTKFIVIIVKLFAFYLMKSKFATESNSRIYHMKKFNLNSCVCFSKYYCFSYYATVNPLSLLCTFSVKTHLFIQNYHKFYYFGIIYTF